MALSYVVINISPRKIYHTTPRNNKLGKKLWDEYREGDPNIILPPEGEYHTSLDIPKYFTLHPKADYSNPHFFPENIHELPEKEKPEVFLEYSLKEDVTLHLLAVTPLNDVSDVPDYWQKINKIIKDHNYDGYIKTMDFYEIYLLKPKQFIKDFKEIPFSINDDDIYVSGTRHLEVNIETQKMLGFKNVYSIIQKPCFYEYV